MARAGSVRTSGTHHLWHGWDATCRAHACPFHFLLSDGGVARDGLFQRAGVGASDGPGAISLRAAASERAHAYDSTFIVVIATWITDQLLDELGTRAGRRRC